MAEERTSPSRNQVRRAGELLRRASVDGKGPHASATHDAVRLLEAWRDQHLPVVSAAVHQLRRIAHPFEVSIAARLKATDSMLAKLARSPSAKVDTMQDIAGCRIVLPDLDGALAVSARCRESGLSGFTLLRFDDHLSVPRPTGYRAHHLVVRHEDRGLLVEVQVRSILQHHWASLVEDLGRRSEQPLKHGVGDPLVLDALAELAAVVEDVDRGRRPGASIASLRDIRKGLGGFGPDIGAETTHD